ncbi:MAG: PAS domain S-box protein [Candidatus Marinimicrobia bacterium]|nr:PAS domain S-box protein [Candidatus Neomarinimicrobiota bacterium]
MGPKKGHNESNISPTENHLPTDLSRAIWEKSLDGLCLIDSNGMIVRVNPVFCQMIGKTQTELEGQLLPVIYAEQDGRTVLTETIKQIQQKKIFSRLERNAILWNGREIWFELCNSLIEPEFGHCMLLGIFRDITEHRQTEQALRESERKLSTLVVNLPGAAYRCLNDAARTMIFISEECQALTGYPASDLIENKKISYNQIILPEDREYISKEIQTALKENSHFQLLYRIVTPENEEKWVWEQGIGIYDEKEQFLAIEGFILDISDKVKTYAALQSTETRFSSVWDGSFDGMRLTDKDGKMVAVNDAFCRQVGMRKSNLEGASMGIIYPVEQRAAIEKQYCENFKKRSIKSQVEACIQLWNDQTLWFEISSSFIENGEQTCMLSIFRNVTKRKKIEADLADSARRFRWLYEFAPIAYHTITPEGTIIDVNRQWCRIMGYDKEEVCGRPIFDFVIKSEREAARRSFAEKKLSKQPYITGHERRYLTKSGEVRTFAISDYFIVSEDGIIHSIQTTMSDITELKLTEEALRLSEAKFRNLVESSLDIIWQVDNSGKILYVSPNAKDVLRRAPDKIIGKLFMDIFPSHSVGGHLKNIAKLFAQHKAIKNYELVITNRHGQETILEVNAVPSYDGGAVPVGYIGTARDITLQKAAEKEQVTVQKLESLCLLAGGIAHDFNNLLVGILGNISLAKMKIDDPEIHRIIERAEQAALRSRDLTQQLLTFAKGGAPIKEKISIAKFLRETVEFALAGSTISCRFDLADELPQIEADRGQLTQVIQNLTINAVQAMPSSGKLTITATAVDINPTIKLPVNSGYYLKIGISDTGIGIPHKLLTKIFDPYFSTKPHGSGLGLSVVYSIIQKHSGYIFVESKPGIGTTFTIYLPAIPGETKESSRQEVAIPHGSGKVLVMDDDELIREVAVGMISSLGYEVHPARNGEAAIQLYKSALDTGKPFDIVIMDLTIIGGMGGKETIVELKKIDPQIKALVSSGYSTDPIMSAPEKYGFLGVIAKPYRMEDLSHILKTHVVL